jgi:hypothetical protein
MFVCIESRTNPILIISSPPKEIIKPSVPSQSMLSSTDIVSGQYSQLGKALACSIFLGRLQVAYPDDPHF